MEILLNFFEETLINKNHFITSNLRRFYDNWKMKRIALNIIWGLINITTLIFLTNIMIAIHFELLWLSFLILYSAVYWILSSLLIDTLIGDEIDNKMSHLI